MRGWVRAYRQEVCLFLLLLVSYGYFLPRWASWSQNSRLDLVLAMVDQGTLRIDAYYENTGDYAFYEGHYYSDKAPGMAFLGVPFYAAFKGLTQVPPVARLLDRVAHSDAFAGTLREEGTGLLADKVTFAAALYFVTFFTVSIPAALLGVLVYDFLAHWIAAPGVRLLTTVVYALATPAFAYSGMFFSHQTVACCLFAAFYLAFQARARPISRGRLFLIGVLLGWAVISEYPAALIAVGIGLYTLGTQRSVRTVVWGTLGALGPSALLMAYDWAIFGSIWPKGYLYSVNYHHLHDVGLVSVTYPHAEALWGITFGSYRGLFFLSPVLLIAVVGLGSWLRRRMDLGVWAVCVWTCVSYVLFNGSSIMWEGGYAVGPRYLVPMLPFLTPGLALGLELLWARGWGRALVGGLTAWSWGAVWMETISGQSFPDWTPNPLFAYSLPRFVRGDIARNLGMGVGLKGHHSLIPLALVLGALLLLSFMLLEERGEVRA